MYKKTLKCYICAKNSELLLLYKVYATKHFTFDCNSLLDQLYSEYSKKNFWRKYGYAISWNVEPKELKKFQKL